VGGRAANTPQPSAGTLSLKSAPGAVLENAPGELVYGDDAHLGKIGNGLLPDPVYQSLPQLAVAAGDVGRKERLQLVVGQVGLGDKLRV